MKKIKTPAEIKKEKVRNQWIVGITMIALMLFSVLGYSISSNNASGGGSSNTVSYNGFNFNKNGDYWQLNIGNAVFVFKYNPTEIGKININDLKKIGNYSNSPIYVYSEDSDSKIELYRNLNQFALRMQDACPKDKKCTNGEPKKDCTENFIIVEENLTESITQEDNCVFIKAPEGNLTEATDEFLFNILGVR